MPRLALPPDDRTARQRSDALASSRDSAPARAQLARVLEPLDHARLLARDGGSSPEFWANLDRAYDALDRYLNALISSAKLRVQCRAGCSACCTDAPSTLPIEGARLARALLVMADGRLRIQRAVDNARKFQRLLLRDAPSPGEVDSNDTHYRRTQLRWRALGYPCPVLDDRGNCTAYEARPLACRIHMQVLDPQGCAPSHPEFLTGERPPLWRHPREAEVERRLVAIGRALGLPSTPNLPWAVAAVHDHPRVRAP